MLCAFSDDVLECIEWRGYDAPIYPQWFNDYKGMLITQDAYGHWLFHDDKGSFVITEGDVFIRNKYNIIKYFTLAEFQAQWYIVQ